MPIIEIEGVGRVEVDDTFSALSPEEQGAAVDEIAATAKPPEQAAADPAQPTEPTLPAPAFPGMVEEQVSNVAAKQGRLDVGAPGESAFGLDLPGGGAVTDAGGIPEEAVGVAREAIGGATFETADEIEARIRAIGGGTVDEELAAVRAEKEQFRKDNPALATAANVGGILTTALIPAGAVVRGGSLISKVGRGAGAGAAFGAASEFGAGEGGFEPRLERAKTGAQTGAAIGAAVPIVGKAFAETIKLFRNKVANAQTLDELSSTAQLGFEALENAGIRLKPQAFENLFRQIPQKTLERIDPGLTPKAFAAFRRLRSIAETGSPSPGFSGQPSLSALINERKFLNKVIRGTTDNADRGTLQAVRGLIDDFIGDLSPNQLANVAEKDAAKRAVKVFREANRAYRKFARGDVIQRTVERAELNVKQGGLERSLKNEFKKLVRNDKEMRLFNKAERKAIRRAASRGVISGPLAAIGTLAPRGFFSIGAPATAAISGVPGALAVPAVGQVARSAANVAARRRAQGAFETATQGEAARAALPAPVERGVNALLFSQVPGAAALRRDDRTNALLRR